MIDQVSLAILQHNLSLMAEESNGKTPYLWPCLVGESGTGKTATAEAVAKKMGREIVKVFLQTMLPEDIQGLPSIQRNREVVQLEWVSDIFSTVANEPVRYLVFLDELDKPRHENISTVLSILTDLEWRRHSLKGVVFMAAMQPVDIQLWRMDETYKALMARFIFLHSPADIDFVLQKHRRTTVPPVPLLVNQVALPKLESLTLRQLDWLLSFASKYKETSILYPVVSGVVEDKHVNEFVSWLGTAETEEDIADEVAQANDENILDVLNKDPGLVHKLSIPAIQSILVSCVTVPKWKPEVLELMLDRLLAECENNEIINTFRNIILAVEKGPTVSNSLKCAFEPITFDEWDQIVINLAAKEAKRIRAARNQQQP